MSIFTSLLLFLGLNPATGYANLNVKEFAELSAQKGVVILDVRTPEEFAEGHIAGAINVNVNDSDFGAQIAALRLAKGKTLAVYCRSGRRSANACRILIKAGYKKVNNLSTGIIGWTENGKPVVK